MVFSMRGSARSPRIWIRLRIQGLEEKLARAVLEALKPDDLTAPAWLRIEERVEDGDLVVYIETAENTSTRVGSLRNTVDEILSYTYALLKTIEETAKALKEADTADNVRE